MADAVDISTARGGRAVLVGRGDRLLEGTGEAVRGIKRSDEGGSESGDEVADDISGCGGISTCGNPNCEHERTSGVLASRISSSCGAGGESATAAGHCSEPFGVTKGVSTYGFFSCESK